MDKQVMESPNPWADKVLQILEKQAEEIIFWKRQLMVEKAKREALSLLTMRHLAKLNGYDERVLHDEYSKLVKYVYDQEILKLGDQYTAFAESLDIRPHLPESERPLWNLPENPYDSDKAS